MGDDDVADFVDMEQARQKKDSLFPGDPKFQTYHAPQDLERAVVKDKSDEDIDFITALQIDDIELSHSSLKQ